MVQLESTGEAMWKGWPKSGSCAQWYRGGDPRSRADRRPWEHKVNGPLLEALAAEAGLPDTACAQIFKHGTCAWL